METGRRGQPEPEGGNRGPREASSTKLQAGFIANQEFLGFRMVDIHWEGRSQRSAPQKRYSTPEKAYLLYTQKTERLGWGERIRRTPNLGVTVLAKHLII